MSTTHVGYFSDALQSALRVAQLNAVQGAPSRGRIEGSIAVAVSYDLERLLSPPNPPTPEGLRVARVFRALREEAGLTQEDIARRIDLTLSGYRPYEQGRRQLRLEQVPTFARAFGVTPEMLAARLGLPGSTLREARVAEGVDLIEQLADEPPEVADTLLKWWRESLEIQRRLRLGRDN